MLRIVSQQEAWREKALAVLGIASDSQESPEAGEREIRYAYYRLAQLCHPDRLAGRSGPAEEERAQRIMALLNEAKDLALRRRDKGELLGDAALVRRLMELSEHAAGTVREHDILTYDEWQRQQFYDVDAASLWPY